MTSLREEAATQAAPCEPRALEALATTAALPERRLPLSARLAQIRPEFLLLIPFVALFVVGLAVGLPLSLPNGRGLAFVERHYFRPLLFAGAIQAVVLLVRRRRVREPGRVSSIAVLGVLVAVTILVHFNFKAWMPLVNPLRFDLELANTDAVFGDLVPALIATRQAIAGFLQSSLSLDVDPLYHSMFVAMFFASFSAHAVFDTTLGLRRVVAGACLVLLLGGIAYWILPAKGPFIFRTVVVNKLADNSQLVMSRWFDAFVATGQFPKGYFAAPLAAVPSLHTAHAVLFCVYAWRKVRWLCWLFIPCLLWILIEAVATGWHYVIDLPAGALLAFFCVWAVDKLMPQVETAQTALGTEVAPERSAAA